MSKPDTPGVVLPPPLIFLGFLLVGYLANRWIGPETLGLEALWRRGIACVLVVAGLTLDGLAAGAMRRRGTALEPWKPTSVLIDSGVFGLSRNPIYIGFALTYIGFAVAMDSALALGLVLPLLIVIDRFVIVREEAYLERQFGETYRQYKQKVRRWL